VYRDLYMYKHAAPVKSLLSENGTLTYSNSVKRT